MKFDHTQTTQFLKWLDLNPDGYVAAFHYGAHPKLHRARCYSLRKPSNHKDAIKFCNPQKDAVEAWAGKQDAQMSFCRLACCFAALSS
jgi:hypothetical protein